MTSSPELNRTVVLRGIATQQARPARISSDLRTSPFVGGLGVDPRLVDPSLEAVVALAEERARLAGWERGRQEGTESARHEFAQQAAVDEQARALRRESQEQSRQRAWGQALDTLRISCADLDARDAPVFEDIERSVARMAVEIAEVLIGRHLELAKTPALDAVHRALALAPRQSTATVRLHPDSAHELADVSGALPGGSVTVVVDPSIEVDGCVVEAGDRTIDSQLGQALQRLREVLA
jgi:flagellar assembly protein FliH